MGIDVCASKGTFNVVTQRINQTLIRSRNRGENNTGENVLKQVR